MVSLRCFRVSERMFSVDSDTKYRYRDKTSSGVRASLSRRRFTVSWRSQLFLGDRSRPTSGFAMRVTSPDDVTLSDVRAGECLGDIPMAWRHATPVKRRPPNWMSVTSFDAQRFLNNRFSDASKSRKIRRKYTHYLKPTTPDCTPALHHETAENFY